MKLAIFSIAAAIFGGYALVLSWTVPSVPAPAEQTDPAPVVERFRLDPARSTFICHANRAGLAYFKGHSHRVAVKDFEGEASMSLDSVEPASLTMTIRAASLEETDPVFT